MVAEEAQALVAVPQTFGDQPSARRHHALTTSLVPQHNASSSRVVVAAGEISLGPMGVLVVAVPLPDLLEGWETLRGAVLEPGLRVARQAAAPIHRLAQAQRQVQPVQVVHQLGSPAQRVVAVVVAISVVAVVVLARMVVAHRRPMVLVVVAAALHGRVAPE